MRRQSPEQLLLRLLDATELHLLPLPIFLLVVTLSGLVRSIGPLRYCIRRQERAPRPRPEDEDWPLLAPCDFLQVSDAYGGFGVNKAASGGTRGLPRPVARGTCAWRGESR